MMHEGGISGPLGLLNQWGKLEGREEAPSISSKIRKQHLLLCSEAPRSCDLLLGFHSDLIDIIDSFESR
jgi:hypothetical protein